MRKTLRSTRLEYLAAHEPETCSPTECSLMAHEVLRLRRVLEEIQAYAEGHHGDQGSSCWLHSLTVDIPHRIAMALNS